MDEASLTRRQREILDFLRAKASEFDHPPTLDELAIALGVRSRGSLHKQIRALADAGFVEPMNRLRRGVRLSDRAQSPPPGTLPLLGRIAAGHPIEALSDEQHIEVPSMLRTRADCFVLQVQGDSMIEDGILDGDWVVVEPREHARNGEVVVVLVDEAEATVKRLLQRPDAVVLIPANGTMEPMSFSPDRVRIQGVVVGQMRAYR